MASQATDHTADRGDDFDRVEILGRLSVVEQGKRTSLERQLQTQIAALVARVETAERAAEDAAVERDAFRDASRFHFERVRLLTEALREAIGWARRPSPIPIEPFQAFVRRAEKLLGGCICPSLASNRGECPVHDEKGRVRAALAAAPAGDSVPHPCCRQKEMCAQYGCFEQRKAAESEQAIQINDVPAFGVQFRFARSVIRAILARWKKES